VVEIYITAETGGNKRSVSSERGGTERRLPEKTPEAEISILLKDAGSKGYTLTESGGTKSHFTQNETGADPYTATYNRLGLPFLELPCGLPDVQITTDYRIFDIHIPRGSNGIQYLVRGKIEPLIRRSMPNKWLRTTSAETDGPEYANAN
jgi:hypothetical protein